MKIKSLLTAALISATSISVIAQRHNRNEKDVVSTVLDTEADQKEVEKTLKNNAPQATNDNGLPRFALVGKEKKFYLGIGGQFLGEGVFDWGDAMPSPLLFTPSALTAKTPGNGGSTRFAWQSSSIFINFVAMPDNDNKIGVFFKANFTGNNNNFSCYHFYAKYRGFTAGYTSSLFADGAAEPMTIDFEGPNGYPYSNLFTAYWTQNFNSHFSGAIGLEEPTSSMTAGDKTEIVNQRTPAIPFYVQYANNSGSSHIRLSGLVRPMQYRNLELGKNETLTGLGVQLSGMAQIVSPLTVNYNIAYGTGIGSYLQDDYGLGLDALPSTTVGKMNLTESMGVTAGVSYEISSKIQTNLSYSHLTNWTSNNTIVSNDQYRFGDYVAANVIYSINKFISAGIEYDYGHRKNFDQESLRANRIQAQLAVTF